MNRYEHLRSKAVELRKRGYSLTAIQERLSVGKTTAYYWIKKVSCPETKIGSQTNGQKIGTEAMQRKYASLRKQAYDSWGTRADELLSDIDNRDFALLYMTEGYRKTRNIVSICNSNPSIVSFSYRWLQRHTTKAPRFIVRLHPDSDAEEVTRYWGRTLKINPKNIHATRKSNSGRMAHRNWRSKYCVFTVAYADTYLRSKIQALMDHIQSKWDSNGA